MRPRTPPRVPGMVQRHTCAENRLSLRPDCQWFARASRHRSGQWRHRPAAWFSLGSCDAHSLRALPNVCLLPPHSYSRCISGGGRPTCQALTGVPASDNVRGWRGSIPLGVLPSGSSSSASSSEMVCALPSNSRSLASHQALCARAPLALAGPLTNGAWALACADHRPDHRRRHRRRRHHQRRFRRRHRCCAHASVGAHVDSPCVRCGRGRTGLCAWLARLPHVFLHCSSRPLHGGMFAVV